MSFPRHISATHRRSKTKSFESALTVHGGAKMSFVVPRVLGQFPILDSTVGARWAPTRGVWQPSDRHQRGSVDTRCRPKSHVHPRSGHVLALLRLNSALKVNRYSVASDGQYDRNLHYKWSESLFFCWRGLGSIHHPTNTHMPSTNKIKKRASPLAGWPGACSKTRNFDGDIGTPAAHARRYSVMGRSRSADIRRG